MWLAEAYVNAPQFYDVSINHWLNPNLAFQHYYTSGDDNPNDNRYDQFERLFGGRRTDLNNTSIHLSLIHISEPTRPY